MARTFHTKLSQVLYHSHLMFLMIPFETSYNSTIMSIHFLVLGSTGTSECEIPGC